MPRKIGAYYLCYQNWLGRWFLVQTFDEDDQKVQRDILEIQTLLNDSHDTISASMNQQRAWEREYSSVHAIPTTTRLRPSSAILKFNDFLQSSHLQNLSILDLGAGAGRNSIFLAKQGHRVTAVDFASPALQLLQSKIADSQVAVVQHDLTLPLPFADDTFDATTDITTTTSLALVEAKRLTSEVRRVTKPGGYIVIYIHSRDDGYLRAAAPGKDHYEVDGTGIIDYTYSELELRALYKNWEIIGMQHIEKEDELCGEKYTRRLWYLLCRNKK